jgi:tetratricopeptide (TPR) repeat protein
MINQPMSEFKARVTLLGQANERRRQENHQTAMTAYLRYIERFGESADLFAMIAKCYFALAASSPNETGRDFKEAVLCMEKAVSLAPKTAHLRVELAQYYSLGLVDYKKALQEYCHAIDLDPNNIKALIGAASLYGVPEEVVTLDEAVAWLEQAIQLQPDEPNYHYRLGQLYKEAGRPLDAKQEWLEALLCSQPLDPIPARIIKDAFESAEG